MTCDVCGRDFPSPKSIAAHRGRAHPEITRACGTVPGYDHGCRCPDCRRVKVEHVRAWRRAHPDYYPAWLETEKARRAAAPPPVPPPLSPHGTMAAGFRHYQQGEQPCDPCRRALVDYNRDRRAARRRARARQGPWWCVVCDYLETHGPLTATVLVDLIRQRHHDVKATTVRKDLGRLRKLGLVDLDDDQRWRVTEPDWLDLPALPPRRR